MPEKISKVSFAVVFALLIAILPLIGSSLIGYYISDKEAYFSNLNLSFLALWAILWAIAAAFALINPTFLALIYGYFIGFAAFPLLAGINLLAIFLVYSVYKIGKLKLFEDLISQNPKALNLLAGLKKEELKVIFFTKLSPVLPFTLTNICFAVSKSKLSNILLGGFLGMIPRTLLAIYTGMQAKALREIIEGKKEGSLDQLFIVILFVISIVGLIYYLKKALKTSANI
jgi:uncharacterized membrane protein YdjX (TVP38/TMEM64 family)